MRIFNIGKIYTVRDLNTPPRKLMRGNRGKVKVVIVDDEDFIYIEELRRSGFNITKYEDVPDLQTLDAFQIIICDIKGVGKKFNSPAEGAFLIRELKKKYPLKAFAAYTGSTYDISINTYLEGVKVIKKDILIDDWCIEIDTLIKYITDPKEIWNKIRDILIREEVPLLSLVKLEHEYVDIVLNRNSDFHNFPSDIKKFSLDSNVINVIEILISGLKLAL